MNPDTQLYLYILITLSKMEGIILNSSLPDNKAQGLISEIQGHQESIINAINCLNTQSLNQLIDQATAEIQSIVPD